MSSLLQPYMITQESAWAGRRICAARERRTGQVVYLMGEPLGILGGAHEHPNLPALRELGTEEQTRWWVGYPPDGEKLEDLRLQGNLTESELLAALLSVIDGLLSLSAMVPPPVPAYLDPACIIRDRMGRWVLDWLALAHAPEAHTNSPTPLGVYSFGVLLYWVVTGDTIRRSRVQVSNLEGNASPGLQLIIIRCVGRSYPSLAELRAELSRAGKDREFQAVVQRIRARAQTYRLESMRPAVRTPHIPIDDRPWATPPAPKGGYSRGRMPMPNRRVGRPWRTWLGALLFGLFVFVLAAGIAVRLDMVPLQYLPAWAQPLPTVVLFPKPQPDHLVHSETALAGQPVQVYLDGRSLGEAVIYTSPNYPYMTLADLNRLLGRSLEWSASPGGQVLLQERERTLSIDGFEQVGDTLWVKLLPGVQRWLGITFQSYRSGILHFSTKA